jgi:hypothetical protein
LNWASGAGCARGVAVHVGALATIGAPLSLRMGMRW